MRDFNLSNLMKVPGRVKFTSEETGIDEDVIQIWQKKASALVESMPWLEDYKDLR